MRGAAKKAKRVKNMEIVAIKDFLENTSKGEDTVRNAMRDDIIDFDMQDSCWYGYFNIIGDNIQILNPATDTSEKREGKKFCIKLKSRLSDDMLFSLAYLLGHELDCDPDELTADYWESLSGNDQEIIAEMMAAFVHNVNGIYFLSTFFEDDVQEMYEKICSKITL
jgi:hypothetical protein